MVSREELEQAVKELESHKQKLRTLQMDHETLVSCIERREKMLTVPQEKEALLTGETCRRLLREKTMLLGEKEKGNQIDWSYVLGEGRISHEKTQQKSSPIRTPQALPRKADGSPDWESYCKNTSKHEAVVMILAEYNKVS